MLGAIEAEFVIGTKMAVMRSSREVIFYLCMVLLRSIAEQRSHSGWPPFDNMLRSWKVQKKAAENIESLFSVIFKGFGILHLI